MASVPRARSSLIDWYDPPVLRFTNAYIKRLLIERPRIRARLENPGGSVILMGVAATTEQANEYSTDIGNTFHLDLVAAEEYVQNLRPEERRTLTDWVNGLTSEKAAEYYGVKPSTIRMRRKKALSDIKESLSEGEESGRAG